MALYEMKEELEKVILVGVSTGDHDDTEQSLDELGDLVKTAGAEVVAKVIQNREAMHPGTYVGKGKIEEIKELLWELGATGVVCDDELSPAQMNNLTEMLETKVMDRTLVILDIFPKVKEKFRLNWHSFVTDSLSLLEPARLFRDLGAESEPGDQGKRN